MSTNDFLAFATAGGANVVSQATYAAAGYVGPGRSSGILPSNVYNKIARQANWMAHCLAQFVVQQSGQDVLDNADEATFITNLIAAIGASSPVNATTGDAKLTLKSSADAGWLLMNDGTIGNASSGASYANAASNLLFTLIWNNVSNTFAPVFDSAGTPVSRGVSAAADFAANRRISLTKQLGRAIVIAGNGAGLTSRQLGETMGEETHLLSTPEIPAHSHGVTDPTHNHSTNNPAHAHGTTDPAHTHFINDPSHAHGITDPTHNHSLNNPTHGHSTNNPAHSHGITDPGHVHGSIPAPIGVISTGATSGGPPNYVSGTGNSGSNVTGISINNATTAISVNDGTTSVSSNGTTTNISINSAFTGITANTAVTGLGINNATTNISVNAASTGISINNAGGGGAHNNMQPSSCWNIMVKL